MNDNDVVIDSLAERSGIDREQLHSVFDALGLTAGLAELTRTLGPESMRIVGRGELVLAFRVGGSLVAA